MLPTFDTIQCVPVDYMHAVLLGVSKKLATLWFNSNNSSKEWYVSMQAKENHNVFGIYVSLKSYSDLTTIID